MDRPNRYVRVSLSPETNWKRRTWRINCVCSPFFISEWGWMRDACNKAEEHARQCRVVRMQLELDYLRKTVAAVMHATAVHHRVCALKQEIRKIMLPK